MTIEAPDLLDRFLRYVRIDTQSDEHSSSVPSTQKQLDLSRILADECREMGLTDVELDPSGTVYATVPGNDTAPTIAWLAHVDTSPEFSGTGVNPVIHENYAGGDLVLPGDSSRVIRVSEQPALNDCIGHTLVTSDGTTLLGADDKSGVAVCMAAAQHLLSHPQVPRCPVRLCFTCDEEIGRGADGVSFEKLGAICGYTLDGDSSGKVDCETFSADLAVVNVTGINAHPSVGKGAMVNAIRILGEFLAALPTDRDCPEVTDGREGFLHPYQIDGGVPSASVRIILRDFEESGLRRFAELLDETAQSLREKHPRATIDIEIHKQYRNMREGLAKEPRALKFALEATRRAGMEPEQAIIRGGTDGSILTERGLPTPNLSTGEHNPHSPLEWTSLEEMQRAATVLVELAQLWSEETR